MPKLTDTRTRQLKAFTTADRHAFSKLTGTPMRQIVAEGFKDVYFQDGGARAMGLSDVTLNDIDYPDLDY
ncbi:hypothetical protein GCM10010508_63660 [Streptomyces naganishii JCM 4654]|uniref:Uncharacterized protein n=1 Tax=Streptomyces naganishii JCM 4654 TaxID=1306179 RepID=A0A918YAX2_9ACTN|nr:hypothetical protein GCM10010508_63660 [Streptomyces naganishii JCM 4654]